jgi:acetoin utilization protein AcuC
MSVNHHIRIALIQGIINPMKTALLYSEGLAQYDFGWGHPFRGDRYPRFMEFFQQNLNQDDFDIVEPSPVSDEDLMLVHSEEYIRFVESFYRAQSLGLDVRGAYRFLSGDNIPRSGAGDLAEGARLGCGSSKLAGEGVVEGRWEKAVALGGGMHHASREYGEGFCILNDVAICALNLKKKYGLERILILDTDAHAGNGTAKTFYDDPEVLFIDLHQDPRTIYPGKGFAHEIGQGKGKGYTVNIPLPLFAGYDSYKLVMEEIALPLSLEFNPQIIIRNGGSDPHFADELTQLGLNLAGFHMIGEKTREMAKVCQDKEVDLLLSGYNLEILPLGWASLISGLMDLDREFAEPLPEPPPREEVFTETKEVVAEVKRNLQGYWRSLG